MRKSSVWFFCLAVVALAVLGVLPDVWASGGDLHHEAEEIGKHLGVLWVVPFACMLLSIAVMPLAVPHFWHHHYGKVAAFWSVAFLVPFALFHGFELATYSVVHTIALEYVSFLILLFSLFTIAGGVCLRGSLVGTPQVNTVILLIGTLLASWMGTTGAAMLLIRPLMRAISHRKYKVHTIVFFIFLVANIGGSLTPLGDPPLFLGFLKGVSFFWTTVHLFMPFAAMSAILLTLYFIIDTVLFGKEGRPQSPDAGQDGKLRLEGSLNLLLLGGVVAGVLMSGMWKPEGGFTLYHVHVELQNVARDVLLLILAGVSLKTTALDIRRRNEFNWEPIIEVAKLFAGIFLTMIPAIAILRAGMDGALSGIIALVSTDGVANNAMYFWLTGALSSFLDNAPTYLVFFNTAGGDASFLMEHVHTLMAISAGAVFMGANTYIGNAPNFMVRSIAESSGIKMPSFFGYMAWSVGILIPSFVLMTVLFF
ncbi:sodium:proton antiporter [Desulfomicrobium escambiense]|uniref:sodium:proton antiporter n=1 Tax=Desulfomicrobium escambiense TaxID=29503 RepID=UPI00040A8BDB|nr:sodium:proton antiporter [Desulfomicrobium escambiense]